eukprot:CAMPEP_0115695970 /NCGR_PEP_ID=MMETSP0272-20121206/65041_1 /TAXON_ID=71861 /ORGANISM="Scrippsiella trochoidea, Strain CCMP3099" /LENGTH=42 /DNA_ID= /DNA_START= /DNA_END= /DNA_ORIENTATION=
MTSPNDFGTPMTISAPNEVSPTSKLTLFVSLTTMMPFAPAAL